MILSLFLYPVIAMSAETSTTQRPSVQTGRLWDVIIKTCDAIGSGTDASTYLKIYYEQNHDGETFQLDNPGRNDFERGARDHFKLFFKQTDIINMGLYWWPGFSISQHWCVDWVLFLNSDTETCFEGLFSKWIHHYRDPPTYASSFHRLSYSDCVGPASPNATRSQFVRFEDPDRLRSS